ncbi:MAG: TIGR02757 family protein [Flavobacteriales bacterium]|nr:MAG: TIGR02757 family protein [Flavobacteriales bacterium]
MHIKNLQSFLDEKADAYNHIDFIQDDPIQIPHLFSQKEDIEIIGFLTAIIAWGNRKSIIQSAHKMLDWMGNSPYDFVMNVTDKELMKFQNTSVHRTFKGEDFVAFILNLKRIYTQHSSLENVILLEEGETNYYHALHRFRAIFLSDKEHRSKKHISSTYKNSSAKRLMMFLRWMVRKDNRGVDFGLWQKHSPAYLSIPLDVHTGNISRKLGLITRSQNDWKTVVELDAILRKLDAKDPAKYDFALFGLGVNGDF